MLNQISNACRGFIIKLHVQSDQESKLKAQGKFLGLLLGDKAHLLSEPIQ